MSGLLGRTGGKEVPVSGPEDPLVARRARLARLASLGRQVGYSTFALSIGLLVLGLATDFTDGISAVVIGLLVGGSAVLAPAILLHYAVRGAEREETERDS